ncbi:branched-chain amino acid ABC transporter permease [Actinomadura rugatobispora]|uniref:Branched-chain amino acid ABC transporter permease n=1 Tax=Actinomadura rugatobispora TaxID=1994 RepID=A0ABW1AEH8_9ACTN|nr:branched-chain amino acid ABC transporter permease [Actinomadura rugatobispora]
MIELLNIVLRAVQTGAIYASIAVGLNLTIGATRIFNFAHGEAVMIGAMLGVILWSSAGLPVVLAAAVAVAAAALFGAVTDRVAVRPLGERAHTTAIVSTLAIALLLTSGFTEVIVQGSTGTDTRRFDSFLPWTETYSIGGVFITPDRLFPIVVLGLMLLFVRWFTKSTAPGRSLGALADDREAAAMRGIPVRSLQTMAFAVGAALAAIAGFAAGPVTQASVAMGAALTIKGFVAAAIGGMPRISGAVAGGMALGAVEQFTVGYLDTGLQDPIVLIALVALLYVRPQGILGQSYRVV